MPITTTTASQAATDPVFFFSIVQIQVEGILFGLPNYVCEQSKSFAAKITTAQPCVLDGITAAEFRDFLQCLIAPLSHPEAPSTKAGGPPESDNAIRAVYMRQWFNALKLTTRWNFEDARRKAIRKINEMDDPPLKLAVAREYDVPRFLPNALRDLADTKVMTPLNKEDYEILGFDLAIKVNQFREGCNACKEESAGTGDPSEAARRQRLIENIFGAEFAKDLKQGEHDNMPKLYALPVPPGCRRARRM
ncbi:hypothetical protein V8D89_010605 [Ganoderma adspersum]